MNKKKVWVFGAYLAAGLIFMGIGFYLMQQEVEYYDTLVWATGVGLAISAAVNLFREYRGTRPQNRQAYEERLAQQRINMKDERKQSLRQLAVYRTFQIFVLGGLWAGAVLIWLRADRAIAWTIFAIVIGQYLVASVIYKYLCRRM